LPVQGARIVEPRVAKLVEIDEVKVGIDDAHSLLYGAGDSGCGTEGFERLEVKGPHFPKLDFIYKERSAANRNPP